MNNARNQKNFVQMVSLAFTFLFTYTAVSKLFQAENFTAVLSQMPLIGKAPAFFAYTIPILELAVSMTLLNARLQRLGLFLSLTLMTGFTLFILFMMESQSHLPCSCGGVINSLDWRQHFLCNLVFTALAFIAWRISKNDFVYNYSTSTFYSNKQA